MTRILPMENIKELWDKIIDGLKTKFTSDVVDLWLTPIELFHKNATEFVLQVPNKFFRNWVEENCLADVKNSLAAAYGLPSGNDVGVEYIELQNVTGGEMTGSETLNAGGAKEPVERVEAAVTSIFNPKLSFSKFIVGKQNQFAYSGAWAVANDPGKQYNPLFIWGGVGLGKTHLLNAIGNRVNENFPKVKTLYVQTKTFINDFIDSIRFGTPATFRNKYSNVECLLIDDIQFLVGKASCQEEFFYTFNAIYDSKKQIVLTSDKPPKDIGGLEERLISRFVWGLVVPIDPPDLETRIAILRSKADEERVYVPEDVILYLASEIKTNIRVLEGALTKVAANAALLGTPLTVDTAKKILQDIITKEKETRPVTIERIQKAVAEHYSLKLSDLKSKRRTEMLAIPRHIAMYLSREMTPSSHAAIGEEFGGKDHSTVIHAINKIKAKAESDPFFSAELNKIVKKINYE
ncbi:MAG: chromosomal replication initiator protein DnaA [Elusimicrobia bacterium HGW-Elusimicrobia-1]|nr:MAG: chromosomal replication initiator protein DnaA [Elusimicrobia bacterium HGW-Elusimicrobia-1]